MRLPITVEGKLPYPAHIYILFYNKMISNPTCYISFICAFYHVCSSYRFYAVTALPPLMEYVHYFHTIAGFRKRKKPVKNSYYKISHNVHRKTHLITWNGPHPLHYPYICMYVCMYIYIYIYIYIYAISSIPSMKAYGNQLNITASPMDKYHLC